MASNIQLSEAIDQYLYSRQSRGMAVNTIKGDKNTLKDFLAATGNIYCRSVEPRHVDSWLGQKTHLKASSRNVELSRLKNFFRWARNRNYVSSDPTMEFRSTLTPMEDRLFVPVEDFPRLLDACIHPRDRICTAIGMYLFLRSSEIKTLTVGDVNLDEGELRVFVHKTRELDYMPICAELEEELRSWLTWYAQAIDGPLTDDMYLVPAKRKHPGIQDGRGRYRAYDYDLAGVGVYPYRQAGKTHLIIQRALAALGYPTRAQGCHTLRRSGARAFLEEIQRTEGEDRGIHQVKTMLHHKNISMTERYIGRTPDRARRDRRLKGQRMFSPAVVAENVVELRR